MRYILPLLLLCIYGCAPDISDTDFFREHPVGDVAGSIFHIAERDIDGTTIRLLAEDSLHYGHSNILVEISRDDVPVSSGSVTIRSRWVTADRVLEMPQASSATTVNDDVRFELLPFFLQPAGETGDWELVVDYQAGSTSGTAEFTVEVLPDIWVQHVANDEDYYVSWEKPERPVTGNDDFEVAIVRVTDAGLVPVTDAEIDLYPYMDMGAGEGHSTPYEKPTHVSEGEYRGMINFIMAGGWDMTLYVQRPNVPADTVVFRGFIVY